ncbi:NACHT, LRR and PYD domains-containing protein 5 [Ochotona princeps]|uniref:NACHT, LRR and PYD domains-containing protein 5 n=1 Tax=Ochotona princeps TaxID=9978 RepID=UPI0027154D5A|nr:NACHT, LRR and PYD domains-containing protein 5 [Ochotona princeps]
MQLLADVFNPDKAEARPHTVVLHGKPGIGKSALAHRLMLSWAEGQIYQGLFSYAFFLDADDTSWSEESSFGELIAREWPTPEAPVSEILSRPEKLLFILDGFELSPGLGPNEEKQCRNWTERQPGMVLVHSLLRQVLLPGCFLVVTIRNADLAKLQPLATAPLYLAMSGLSVQRRIQLLQEHVPNEQGKMQVLHSVMDNHQLFDQCQVSTVCLLVCRALELQEATGNSAGAPGCQTLTALYAAFVFHQLAPEGVLQHCLGRPERAMLLGLCRLAAESVWAKRSVFHAEELRALGLSDEELSAPPLMSVLLPANRNHAEERYAFLHLSLRDFFAALYYVLEALAPRKSSCSLLPAIPWHWKELRQTVVPTHLGGMKRFLFGLMSQEVLRALEVLLGCAVPQGTARQELTSWISLLGLQAGTLAPESAMESFYCLFETQDKEFVLLALDSFQDLWLRVSQKMDLIVSSFCLQCCRHLRKIRVDVRDLFLKEEIPTWPRIPQWMQCKTIVDEWWENFCSVLATHPQLQQLDLGHSILNEWAMKMLCAKLRHPTCKIQRLILKGAQVSAGLHHLWATLVTNHNLKHLDLGGTHLQEQDVKMACEALKHPNSVLESLRLDFCGLNQSCYLMISQVLHKSTSLKILGMAGNKVTDWGLKVLCDALRPSWCALRRLTLEDCGLMATSCHILALALTNNRSLTHLCLSRNPLDPEGLSPLCRAIPDSSLQRLVLNHCGLDIAGCGYLVFALRDNKQLTHLSLSQNPLGDSGIKLLYEAMRELSCHLQDLEVAGCQLTAACCESLSHMIMRSKHLKSLDLGSNALGDSGVAALCEGLKQRSSALQRLGLEACELTSDCCKTLVLALSHNQQLMSLNLAQNHFCPQGVKKLCSAFTCPTSKLRVIGLCKEQYPEETRKLLEGVQLAKPHVVIDGDWYSHDEEDQHWWRS